MLQQKLYTPKTSETCNVMQRLAQKVSIVKRIKLANLQDFPHRFFY